MFQNVHVVFSIFQNVAYSMLTLRSMLPVHIKIDFTLFSISPSGNAYSIYQMKDMNYVNMPKCVQYKPSEKYMLTFKYKFIPVLQVCTCTSYVLKWQMFYILIDILHNKIELLSKYLGSSEGYN